MAFSPSPFRKPGKPSRGKFRSNSNKNPKSPCLLRGQGSSQKTVSRFKITMSTTTEKSPATASRVEYVTPPVNLHQDAEGYTLEVEMPGVGKDGVEITAGDGKLVIVGHRKAAEDA